MGKLSKADTKKQNQLLELINSDVELTDDQRYEIYEQFDHGILGNVTGSGSFFTPVVLANLHNLF